LAGTDKRFEAYKKTLFSPETLKLDRELQSRELNEKLNSSISTFLRILSHYIMLKPAHQILEYLIRRYKFVAFTFILDLFFVRWYRARAMKIGKRLRCTGTIYETKLNHLLNGRVSVTRFDLCMYDIELCAQLSCFQYFLIAEDVSRWTMF
jgi:hypothetical protein